MKKLGKILKNKKGFTLVEAIAVVAIMGILATVIGGLVTAGTTAYMRQKENAAAKDLATIVQNEIKRVVRTSLEVYIQNDSLPNNNFSVYDDEGNETAYTIENAPSANLCMFAVEKGVLVYSTDRGVTVTDYFTSRDTETRAFYGSFTIDLHFKPLINTFGEITSVKVFCDVYNAKGQKKFASPGLEIDFIEANNEFSQDSNSFLGIFSYEQSYVTKNNDVYQYTNRLLDKGYISRNPNGFKNFYFRTVEKDH